MRDFFRRRRGAPGAAEQSSVVLSDRQHELVDEELAILSRLAVLLDEYPATEEDRDQISDAKEQLTSLFMLVVVGEFNAGKSAFINALIGGQILPEGVTPTTAVINILTYGEQTSERRLGDGSIERTYPAPFLIDITVVDTPGTNAIIREHEALTQKFVPRSDIVFFVTSADRPFTESEREFMEGVKDWGKKIVVVINKIDLLRDQASVKQVMDFVDTNISRLLGIAPEIFPVSSLMAQQANDLADRNLTESERLWDESRFGNLQSLHLRDAGRGRAYSPQAAQPARHGPAFGGQIPEDNQRAAGRADRGHRYAAYDRPAARALSGGHAQAVRLSPRPDREHHRQDECARRRVLRRHHPHRARHRPDEQGQDQGRVRAQGGRRHRGRDRRHRQRADRLDGRAGSAHLGIDQRAISTGAGWRSTRSRWSARSAASSATIAGRCSIRFPSERRKRSIATTRSESANDLSLSVRNAVAQTAIAEVGAIGLGALVVAAASTVAVDVTGIVAASLLAGLGLFILPRKRRQTREEFRKRSSELEQNLVTVMNEQFEHELQRSVHRMESAIAPYSRFVRDQHAKQTTVKGELEQIVSDLKGMRFKIGGAEDSKPALQAGLRPWSPDEEPKPDYRIERAAPAPEPELPASAGNGSTGTRGLFRPQG